MVKIVSCLMTHTVFLFILIGLILLQQMAFSLYFLQFFYYLAGPACSPWALLDRFGTACLFTGCGPAGRVILQVGFWMTPIFWDINLMSPKIQSILK